MNFECHITIDVADAAHGQYFADNAPPYSGKWKTSEIARDPVLGQATYFYLTAHDTAYEKMHERMVYCRRWLQERGVVVLREKIELIMYDTKSPKLDDRIGKLFEAYDFAQFQVRDLKAGLSPQLVEVLHDGLEALQKYVYDRSQQ